MGQRVCITIKDEEDSIVDYAMSSKHTSAMSEVSLSKRRSRSEDEDDLSLVEHMDRKLYVSKRRRTGFEEEI